MGCVAHWFMERRGLATGIAFIGGGFGGVLFPLMIQSLLPQVGWGWSIRILGFVVLVLCAISAAFCRSRVPPRKGAATTWRETLPDPRIFIDGTGAMVATTAGVLLTDMAYFIPITYVPSYYIDRQLLSHEEALTGQRRSHINFSRFSMLLHALAGTRRATWLIDSADITPWLSRCPSARYQSYVSG